MVIWPNLAGASQPEQISDSLESRQTTDELLQLILENDESDEGRSEDLLNSLAQLQLRPIPINTAEFNQLLQIPFLSSFEASAIIEHRQKNSRPFYSTNDLKLILDPQTIAYISPFISFALPDSLKHTQGPKLFWQLRQPNPFDALQIDVLSRSFVELPSRYGFSNDNFVGSTPKVYNRLQVRYSENLLVSVLAEKDIGERSYSDFSAIGVELRDLYALKTLVVGTYHLQFGQGLAITTDRYFYKSSEIYYSVKQTGSRCRVYASSREANYFNGVVSKFSFSPFQVYAFYSKTSWDGSVTDSSFSSFKIDGLHRTENDLEKVDQIQETTYGTHLGLNLIQEIFQLNLGSTFFTTRFSKQYLPNQTLENRYRFTGSEFSVGSVDWDLTIQKNNIFGEWAYNFTQKAASWVCGIRRPINPSIKASLIYRFYSPKYYSPYASAFAERGDDARNEEGLFFGVAFKLSPSFSISTYYDIFSFPYVSTNTVFPNAGYDYYLQTQLKLSKQLLLSSMFQSKEKQESHSLQEYKEMAIKRSSRFRNDVTLTFSSDIKLKTRIELKQVQTESTNGTQKEFGWLMYEEVAFKPIDKLNMKVRLAVFNTPSYNSAIYTYEPNLPLLLSSRALYGKGHRLLINATYELMKQFKIAFRYANTLRHDVSEIGSGDDTFFNNAPQEFGFGIQARF